MQVVTLLLFLSMLNVSSSRVVHPEVVCHLQQCMKITLKLDITTNSRITLELLKRDVFTADYRLRHYDKRHLNCFYRTAINASNYAAISYCDGHVEGLIGTASGTSYEIKFDRQSHQHVLTSNVETRSASEGGCAVLEPTGPILRHNVTFYDAPQFRADPRGRAYVELMIVVEKKLYQGQHNSDENSVQLHVAELGEWLRHRTHITVQLLMH